MSPSRLVLVLLVLAASRLFSASAPTAPNTLQAGVARADITPDPAMLNWTVVPTRPYGAVHDPLFARALVLSDGTTRLVILQWDLLDAREFAVARVRQAIARATDIPETRIIVSASHNHSGPKSEMPVSHGLRREEQSLRPVQDGPAYREWADRLVTTCAELARKAQAGARPVTLA